jgi:predicted O-methyltransferase YrrM
MDNRSQTTVSPREALRQSIDGYQLSQCLYVAAKLAIADGLKAGPKHVEELAQASGAQPNALGRVLRALASAGVFRRLPDGQFALNEMSEHLCADAPGSLRAWAILAGEQPYPAWGQLLYTVQTGEIGFDHLYGMSNWQYRVQNPSAAQVFNDAMSEGVRASTAAILQAYDYSPFARIVDVGGGQGALLAGILMANPSAHGVLFELEHVVASARPLLQKAGVAERCETIAGSFLEEVPGEGDAYILKDILLNWDDQECVQILRNCEQAMKKNGAVLIMERVIASEKPTLDAAMVDLRMMVMLGGQARTSEELQALLAAAGFQLTKSVPTRSAYQILEGKPA